VLAWLRRRRETAERIEAEAEAVMREYAVRAYAEARPRGREAKSKAEAQNWSRVALVIAERTCKRVGLESKLGMFCVNVADCLMIKVLADYGKCAHARH
jgi:hypothetical protein